MLFRYGYRISIEGYVHPLVGWSIGWLVVGWLVSWSVRRARVTEVMQQVWDVLKANYLRSLYGSMRRRMQMVIEAKGDQVVIHTHDISRRKTFSMLLKPINYFYIKMHLFHCLY